MKEIQHKRTQKYKNDRNNIKMNVTFLANKDLTFKSLTNVSVYDFLFI